MATQRNGTPALMMIGGHEDREGEKAILQRVARHVGKGKLVVSTVASYEPDGLFEQYERAFRDLGVGRIEPLEIFSREEAIQPQKVRAVEGAKGFFFTGGDQLKITSQIGDTPIYDELRKIIRRGGIVAGTSAGASAMCDTMLVSGAGRESFRVDDSLRMSPGLGMIPDVVVDQHFAERGRLGRLLGAVAQNPKSLGIGIDEDTAALVEPNRMLEVFGSGAVYIVDGRSVSASNVTEAAPEQTLSMFGITLHVLGAGDRFDLATRVPLRA